MMFLVFFIFGFLIVFRLIDAPIWFGFIFIISSFAMGFLASAKQRYVIDRGAKVFVGRKISLFGTITLSKQERIDYENIKAGVVEKKEVKQKNGKTFTAYFYTIGFKVDHQNINFSSSSNAQHEKMVCKQACEVINAFLLEQI